METFGTNDFDDENIFITAEDYDEKFKKFIVKCEKKLFENTVMRIKKEVGIDGYDTDVDKKKLEEAIRVSLSIARCLNKWINKTEELELNAKNNTQDWVNFCADIMLYYAYTNALYGRIVPITR